MGRLIMKRYNVLFTFWVIIVVIIFSFLILLGYMYKNKVKTYKDYEVLLVEKTKKYLDETDKYAGKNSIEITIDELIDAKYLDKDDVVKPCEGYVKVNKKASSKYQAIISCKYYKTKVK